MAKELKLTNWLSKELFIAGVLHDIGKIGVDATILNSCLLINKGEEKRTIIDQHPQWGSLSIEGLGLPRRISKWILHHHQRIDGSGYPYIKNRYIKNRDEEDYGGLKGDEIPYGAKFLRVADEFVALWEERAYKRAWTIDEILEYLPKLKNIWLDEDLVDTCVAICQRKDIDKELKDWVQIPQFD